LQELFFSVLPPFVPRKRLLFYGKFFPMAWWHVVFCAVFFSLQEISESHKQLTEAFNQQAQRYAAIDCILEFAVDVVSLCLSRK